MYKHIFFDLDHTIWDFDRNAEETLHELYHTYELQKLGIHSVDIFIETYTKNNHALWAEYHVGKITKQNLRERRFSKTFMDLGLEPRLIPNQFENDYVTICPTKMNLFPHAHETLAYLQQKYTLHIISNGFKESTEMKIDKGGLGEYFQTIFISEVIGYNKPDRAIFEYVMDVTKALPTESLMVGDSIEADIRGAQNFGMQAIYFNPAELERPADVRAQVTCLSELTRLL